jgi:hypothetical protein
MANERVVLPRSERRIANPALQKSDAATRNGLNSHMMMKRPGSEDNESRRDRARRLVYVALSEGKAETRVNLDHRQQAKWITRKCIA